MSISCSPTWQCGNDLNWAVVYKYLKVQTFFFSGICPVSAFFKKNTVLFTSYFPWHLKVLVTFWMLSKTGKWSNSRTCQEHPWSSTAYALGDSQNTKNTCFLHKLCLSVPLAIFKYKSKKMMPPGLLNIRNLYFYFWYLSIFKTKYFNSSSILLGDFHLYLSHFLLTKLYFYSSMTIWVLFSPLQLSAGNAEMIKVLKYVLVELNSIKQSEWRDSLKSLRM